MILLSGTLFHDFAAELCGAHASKGDNLIPLFNSVLCFASSSGNGNGGGMSTSERATTFSFSEWFTEETATSSCSNMLLALSFTMAFEGNVCRAYVMRSNRGHSGHGSAWTSQLYSKTPLGTLRKIIVNRMERTTYFHRHYNTRSDLHHVECTIWTRTESGTTFASSL